MSPGALTFSFADLYPGQYGYFNTRTETIPNASDQTALVDDEEMAAENGIQATPTQHRNIFITLAVVVGLILLLSK